MRYRIDFKYRYNKGMDRICMSIAHRMPSRLRMWVVVCSTNEARALYPDPSEYAGPQGLGYQHIYDGARRRRVDPR